MIAYKLRSAIKRRCFGDVESIQIVYVEATKTSILKECGVENLGIKQETMYMCRPRMSLSDRGVQSMSNQRHATTNKVSRLDKKGASYDFTTNGAVLGTNSTTPRYYITTQLHPCAGGA